MSTFFASAFVWLAAPVVFYTLSGICVVGMLLSMTFEADRENRSIAFWASVFFILLVLMIGNHIGLTWDHLGDNLMLTFICFFGYVAVGMVWSFVRWYFYLRRVLEDFREAQEKGNRLNQTLHDIRPSAAKHKAMITEWILYWPVSFVWTMLNDPLVRCVNFMFGRLRNLYQSMSDKMFNA